MATPELEIISSPSPLINMGEATMRYLTNKKYTDVAITCRGGHKFSCHRIIIASRSKFFEAVLDTDMKERNTGIIDLPEDAPATVSVVLNYLYSDKANYMAADYPRKPYCWLHVVQVYALADRLMIPALKQDAVKFLDSRFSKHKDLALAIERPEFLDAVAAAYNLTPESDAGMRQVFVKHMSTGVINKRDNDFPALRVKLREIPALTIDLAMAPRDNDRILTDNDRVLTYSCTCGRCNKSFKGSAEPKHCPSCRTVLNVRYESVFMPTRGTVQHP